jgi:hypothetical protein
MAAENMSELISSLSEEERDAVREFILFLKNRRSPFLAAVDEFIDEHPELLRRLAQ